VGVLAEISYMTAARLHEIVQEEGSGRGQEAAIEGERLAMVLPARSEEIYLL